MSKSRIQPPAFGRLTVSAFVSAMLQMCARDALAAGPTRLPIPCAGAGVACGTNTTGSKFVTYGTANAPVVSGNTLTVQQTSNNATFNWASFNVTADGKVVFQQPNSGSIALNRIYDANPSSIFGSVAANGQIYLINANGILFGSTATVNVAGLLASSLNIPDATFQAGIVNQFATSSGAATNRAALQPFTDSNGNPLTNVGSVQVESGAQLNAADNGRILLAAPTVLNSGTITAPDGQIILAAGQRVYLQPSDSSDLRGLIVEVDGNGQAANQLAGQLSAPRGNISLVGLMVNQDGRVSATTSVSANGSITLEAANTAANNGGALQATNGGTLEIGANSITEILPEYSDTTTAVAEQAQLPSEINLTGQQVLIHGGTIAAPGGNLSVIAASNPSAGIAQGQNDPNAEIRVDSGTTIDLSGSDAVLPVSYNLLTVQLRGDELENDPTQRGGALQGQTVTVDIRADGGAGTPLADLSSELAAMPQNIAQRTETGGTVSFLSQGDVVMGSGVTVNVSGGQTTFTGGQVQTTQLIGANGQLYDIGAANPLMTYTGLVNPTFTQSYNEWGVQQVVPTPGLSHYESGYVQGASAGTIQIAAPSMAIGATLLGSSVSGPYQRGVTVPSGGTLIIGETPAALVNPSTNLTDFLSPEVDFTNAVSPLVIPDGIPLPTQALQLPTSYLTSDGFTNVQIYSNSRVSLPSGMPLELPSGSSLLIEAPRVDINSSITDLAGALSFINVATVDSSDPGLPRLGVGIGAGVTLDVSGQWTNDNLQVGSVGTGQTLQNAGSIELQLNTSGSALTLGNQVSLKADGGAWLASNGAVTDGKGGSITVDANPAQAALQLGQGDDIEGFGVGTASGGSFALTAPRISVSQGIGTAWTSAQLVDDLKGPGGVLQLYAPLFSDYGFSSISLTASGAIYNTNNDDVLTVAYNTTIDALTRSWQLEPGFQNKVTGGEVAPFSRVVTLPEYSRPVTDVSLNVLREAPLSVTVSSSIGPARLGDRDLNLGSTDMGNLDIQTGASILTDPGASIALTGVGSIDIAGTLRAPGGDISATLAQTTTDSNFAQYLDPGFQPDQGILLASGAVLDVSGTAVLKPSALNLPLGNLLGGGSVTLDAQRGTVIANAGSLINISGSSAVLDVVDANSSSGYLQETVGSAGGTLNVSSPESISLLGSLEGTGGVGTAGTAAAGALEIELTRASAQVPQQGANGLNLPQFPNATPLEIDLVDSTQGQTPSSATSNLAVLGVQQLEQSGIDSLTLVAGDRVGGNTTGVISINTDEPLALGRQLVLDSQVLTVAPGYNANLSAPYVELGSSLVAGTVTPVSGVGNLTVTADQMSLIGTFTLQGMANTKLVSNGDVQLAGVGQTSGGPTGELMTAGNLTIDAERLYPDTNTTFTLSSVPTDGSPTTITVGQTGASPGAPLSAVGTLNIAAPNIDIGGSLYAPFGTINLTASNVLTLDSNSLVSVSGAGLTIPYGQTQYQGGQWIYTNPDSGQQVICASATSCNPALPKAVNLSAPQINMSSSATVDLTGGGDLQAYEFVPGPTGLTNSLKPGQVAGLYAILPAQVGQAAPYDPEESPGFNQNQYVYLTGIPGLAPGYYALLPASYALLKNADLIQIEPSYTSAIGGKIATLADGTPIVAGYLTSTPTGSSGSYNTTTEYEGFAVYPGSYAQRLGDYNISIASSFFTGANSGSTTPVPIPADAGTLNVAVTAALNNSLDLEGKVLTAAGTGGRGAQVNISAPQLEVTPSGSGSSGITVSGSVLQSWNASSLTLGGRSSADGSSIAVTASTVTVDSGVNLAADQLTLVAQQGIEVQSGATLASTSGAAGTTLKSLPTATAVSLTDTTGNSLPEAALLSVSDLSLAEVTRTGSAASGGATITLDSGATLKSGGGLALDTPGAIAATGANLDGKGASWSLSSSEVAFVNSSTALPTGDAATLNIDSGLLGSLQQASAVRIASAGGIDLFTPVSLGATSASSAPTLSSLTLIGNSINAEPGAGNAVFGANSLVVQGLSPTPTAAATTGTGNLTLVANTLQVGPGAMTVNGFGNTQAQVAGAFAGYETGSLNVGGNLQINAVELTAIAGPAPAVSAGNSSTSNTQINSGSQYISNTQIAATGALTIGAPTQLAVGTALPTALGGALSLQGASIEDEGAIVTPSGIANLSATGGNIHLASGATINAGGVMVPIADQITGSPGGVVTLTANTAGASVVLDSGSTIDVAGAGSAPAGSLSITGAGVVDVSGTLNAQAGSAGGTGGSFILNVGGLANGLTPLAANLTAGGFTNAINVEVGTGDLDLASGGALTANNIVLSADSGAVDIAGTLTADSGAQRGFIGLYGGTSVTLEATGQLHADGSGTGGRGGEIDISSTCGTCTVTLNAGSVISATGSGQMGELVVQAPTLGAAGVNIVTGPQGLGAIAANVGQVILEPVMTFNETNAANINTDLANDISQAETYVSGAGAAILASLAPNTSNNVGGPTYSVQTGVVVEDSAADTLNLTGFNLYPQYSSRGAPGSVVDVTVRAAGAINISGTLSDGYTGTATQPVAASTASGSLSFVAGANINSANPLATLAGSSAGLTLANSAIVRTGTGDLNLASAGDMTFGKGAAVYTSGVEAQGVNPLAVKSGTTNDLLSFASGGGNVLIQAGGNINAVPVSGDNGNFSVTGWQVHEGNTSNQVAAQFGINLAGFDWNVGALGGGDVTVAAKGNITELSAATADSMTPGSAANGTSATLYGTGGGLNMSAGGDIGSVQVYVSSGTGTLTAGGGLTAPLTSAGINVGSAFALGNAGLSVWARNSVLVDAVYNPTMLLETTTGTSPLYGEYFTYGTNSGLSLESTTGTVGMEVTPTTAMAAMLGNTTVHTGNNLSDYLEDLPPNLAIQALQGDISFNLTADTYLYPSSTGQLTLLAGRDIDTGSGGNKLVMADNLAATIPTVAATTDGTPLTFSQFNPFLGFNANIHAGDTQPAVIAAGRDIDNLVLNLPKAAQIVAGRDIVDLDYAGQNANPNDITLISAGRDLTNPGGTNTDGILVGGQGAVDVFAGRNIYLGFSDGIVTAGDLYNANLPSAAGADITVMAGLGSPQNADAAGFLQTIVAPSSTYQSELVSYVESVNGQSGLSFAQAAADFKGFSQPQQTALVDHVFFNELLLSGREANSGSGVGFARGYAAIDALFPNSRSGDTPTGTGSYTGPYSGDINMSYSQIYTQSGGNINVLVPGGQIDVGLAVAPVNINAKPAASLGIVAEGPGDVNIYSLGSVNVNQARIFTLGGGNILIWSDLGNIDAGNGSKASLSIPPPTVEVNSQGQITFDYTGAVAGSGIRTIQTELGQAAGSVDLDAPVGTVDAGDAGIGAAGNINIAAQHVIGASNINFGGTATGVPPEVSNLGASLSSATSAAASTTTSAESKATDALGTKTDTAPLAQTALSWLDVFVTGMGEENCKPEDTECLDRQKAPPQQ